MTQHDPKARIQRQRTPRIRTAEERNRLRAAVLARGAEEVSFMDEGMPEGGKWRLRDTDSERGQADE